MAKALAWIFVLGIVALLGLIPGSVSPSEEYTMEKIVCPEKTTVTLQWGSPIGFNPALSLGYGNQSYHASFITAFQDVGPSAACMYEIGKQGNQPGFRALYQYYPEKKKILSCTVSGREIHCKVQSKGLMEPRRRK